MNNMFNAFFITAYFWTSLATAQQIAYGSNNGKYVSIHNTKTYYEEYGKGAPLLLLHGGMGSIADYKLCIPELSKHYRVIAPDAPGQGRSGLADSMSYQLMAEYISTLMDILKLDSAYVMGWSDGGNTALILANMRHDKVRKVVASGANYMLSGYPSLTNNPELFKPLPSNYYEQNKKFIDEYMKIMPRDWKKMISDNMKMWRQKIYFPGSVLEGITIPVMIVLGDKDDVSLEHGLEMHRMIKGSQLCILPNTSHAVFREKPALITGLAIDFFNQKTINTK